MAYSRAGPDGDNWDIYIKAVGAGTRPFRLTEHPAGEWSPVWSPDGREIAFVRDSGSSGAIYTVPSLGGQERKLTDVDVGRRVEAPILPPAPSWSPDGRWLAFAEKPSESQPAHIVRISLETREKQPLTSPPEDSMGDLYPALSPDGSLLAFVRSGAGGGADVWVQVVEGGKPRQLTHELYDFCHSPAWTASGREIVFSARLFAERIFRVSLEGGDPQPVPGAGENAASATIRADRMVYLQMTAPPFDIWRVSGRASRRDRTPEKLIASSQSDGTPAYSPDGRTIAFESNRTGNFNVWICDDDGSHPVQLTSFDSYAGTPRWSPDGRRIVFDSVEAGDWNLYVIEADGGIPRRLTPESSDDYRGVWSRDGRWIYFASNRGGPPQIWKIPSEGGQAVQVTRGGAVYAEPSWDDRHLYFLSREGSIRRVRLEGGEETDVVQGPIAYYDDWALSRNGLYYATQQARAFGGLDDFLAPIRARVPTEYTIRFLEFQSGTVTELFRKGGPFQHHFLGISPDEEWILYGEQPIAQAELMLVENFR